MIPSLTLLLLAVPQQPVPLMEVGDIVGGTPWHVTRFDRLQVANSGDWVAHILWDEAVNEHVVIRNGNLEYDFRQQVPAGPGLARWNAIFGMGMNDLGVAVYSFELINTPTIENEGLYHEVDHILAYENDLVLDPAAPAGSFWHDWDELVFREGGFTLVDADYHDPGAVMDHRCMALFGVAADGSPSGVEQILLQEGDLLGGDPVLGTFGHSRQMDLNNSGETLFGARVGSIPQRDVLVLNGVEIAREGQPSIVPGLDWSDLGRSNVAINNRGDHFYNAGLGGSTTVREVMVLNGQRYLAYGDTVPDISPNTLTFFVGSPVDIADTGDVLWWSQFNDPNADTDTALFLNQDVLVREGVTQVNGVAVDEIEHTEYSYYLTDNGRYVVFEATLADGTVGLYQIDLDPGPVLLPITPGEANATNLIEVVNAEPFAQVSIGASNSLGSKKVACGGGSVVTDLYRPQWVGTPVADGTGTASFSVFVKTALLGTTWYIQALDLTSTSCRVTNVTSVTFQ